MGARLSIGKAFPVREGRRRVRVLREHLIIARHSGPQGDEKGTPQNIPEGERGSVGGGVNALTMETPPEVLHAVTPRNGKQAGWTCVRTVMDSGAVDSVAPSTMAPGVKVVPSPGSFMAA